jgi:hypothetical protein
MTKAYTAAGTCQEKQRKRGERERRERERERASEIVCVCCVRLCVASRCLSEMKSIKLYVRL